MAIYGSQWGNISAAAQIRRAGFDISTASTTWQTASTDSLVAGMYMASFSYSPSTDTGNYPNGDADTYEMRVTLDGTELGATLYGNESAPLTYMMASALTVIFYNNATNDCNFQYRTTDADSGGQRGYLRLNLARLMGYT
tara:strand:- start:66 stop:485 length:420 start_codon:yes stop_codon:yes gene_type:complete